METTWIWSNFTGRSEPVGIEMGYATSASEHEDGSWTWHGHVFASLEDVRVSAKAAGY